MGEAAEVLEFQPNEVETKALSIVDQAKAVKVVTAEDYKSANSLWKSIGDMIKEVDATFAPICDAAHKAWKITVAKRDGFLDPLKEAKTSVKSLMGQYEAAQERIRQEEQRCLAEIARKAEEERLLMEAIAAEEEAQRNGATKEEAAQEAAAIMAEPVYVPPVVVPKAVPKLAGGPIFQTRWDFEVINEALIPRQYLAVDLVKIRQIVTALKSQANIPGIRAFEKRV